MKNQAVNFILIFCAHVCLAQDPLFVNSGQSLVGLNPSFAGSNGGVRNQFSYRNQWPQLSGSFVTFHNSTDIFIKKIKGGIAFTYLRDDQARGTLITDVFNLTYAQYFLLLDGKLKITPSIQGGVFVKKLDINKLNFGQQIDPRRGFLFGPYEIPANKKTNFNISSGLLVDYNHFTVGASVFNINQPDEGLFGSSKLPYRLSLHSSYNLFISERSLIRFFARYQQQHNFSFYQLETSALLFNHLVIGGGYKYSYSPYILLGYRHSLFSIQLCYEKYYSSLSNGTLDAFEFSASFYLRQKELRNTLVDFEKW